MAKDLAVSIINNLRTMRDAGVLTNKLADQEKRLGATIERSNKVKERRNKLGSQLKSFGELGKSIWGGPVEAAIKFESAMAGVKAVVNFKSPDQFKTMQKDILLLSKEIPMAADGLAGIAKAAGQAGIAPGELLRVTKEAAMMGMAFDMSGKDAASVMTGLRSAYQLNQDQVMLLGDAYSHLSNNLHVTEKDMLNLVNNIGDKAKQFGLSGQQAGALGATFLALNVPLKDAENGIDAMFTKLMTADKQGENFQSALASIGMDAKGLKQAIEQDAQGALLNFVKAVNSSGDVTGTLSDLFGEKQAKDVAKLVGSLDTYHQSLELVADKTAYTGSMQKKYEARSETTEKKLLLFNNQVTRLGVTIGSVLLPPLNSLLAIGGTVVGGIADLAERFPLVTKVVVGLTMGLMAMHGAVLAGGYAWTFIQGGWLTAVKAIRILLAGIALATTKLKLFNMSALITNARTKALAVGGAIKGFARTLVSLATRAIPVVIGGLRALTVALMTNPIGLIIGGIALAAGLIYTFWEPIKNFFSGLWDGVKGAFASAWECIKSVLSFSPVDLIINAWSGISNFFSGLWDGVKGIFASAWEWLKCALSFSPVDLIINAWSGISNFFSNLWSGIIDQAKGALDWLLGKFEAVTGFIGGAWSTVKGWFGGDDEASNKASKKAHPCKPNLKSLAMATTVVAAPVAAQPTDIGIPQLTTPQAMDVCAPRQAGQTTHNNNYQISIHQQPCQSSESLVEQIIRELERRQQQCQREVLGDGI